MSKRLRLFSLRSATIFITLIIIATTAEPLFSQSSSLAPFDLNSVPFVPCGWMGAADDPGERYVQFDPEFSAVSRPGDNDSELIKVSYQSGGSPGWAGVYWLPPAPNEGCNWGQYPGITILDATKIVFWARGEHGGEIVEFKAGGIRSHSHPYRDTFEVSTGRISLSEDWQRYEIDLSNQNFEEILGAFAWAAPEPESGSMIFYLDSIRYE